MARFFIRLIDAQAVWARPLGDLVHRFVHWLFHKVPPIHNFLNGTWLGHPLHAVLTDVPVGAFTIVVVLDVVDQRYAVVSVRTQLLARVKEDTAKMAKVEMEPRFEGRQMIMILAPR